MSSDCDCGGACGCDGADTGARPFAPESFAAPALARRMLGRVQGWREGGSQPLAGLGTHDASDPAIALILAWSGALHVLGWNADRLAQDLTLPHSTDIDALRGLVGLTGYRPRPALAATTRLALFVDTLPSSPEGVDLPAGLPVASIPVEGGLPVTFETDGSLRAERRWNLLHPATRPEYQVIGLTTRMVEVTDPALQVKAGDMALIADYPPATKWLFARVTEVERLPAATPPATRLRLAPRNMLTPPPGFATETGRVLILGTPATGFGANAPDLRLMSEEIRESQIPPAEPDAPAIVVQGLPNQWRDFTLSPGATPANSVTTGQVDLSASHPEAVPGRAAVFTLPIAQPVPAFATITDAIEISRSAFALSGRVTRISVSGVNLGLTTTAFGSQLRQTVIWLETARASLTVGAQAYDLPDTSTPNHLRITGLHDLPEGREVMLAELPEGADPHRDPLLPDAPLPLKTELAMIEATTPDPAQDQTLLRLARPLSQGFAALRMVIYGNIAPASQGESLAQAPEILGSGQAALAFPRFTLHSGPVAHLPAPGLPGYLPAITLRVNDRRYLPVESLWNQPGDARIFTLAPTPEGDGEAVQINGRTASGSHNITADYRKGGGLQGNLPPGRIRMMMRPAPGLKGGFNPGPAEGGLDPEGIEAMRNAAPARLRTLDRVVSLMDYQAFAEGYPGVGKALASDLAVGMRRVVCLTLATTQFLPPTPGLTLMETLRSALADVAPPGRAVRLAGFQDYFLRVELALASDPDLPRNTVEAAVRAQLAARFGKPSRAFAEGIHRAQILAAVQAVPGVLHARLTAFARKDTGTGAQESEGRILCPGPRMDGTAFQPAGLLSLAAADVHFTAPDLP